MSLDAFSPSSTDLAEGMGPMHPHVSHPSHRIPHNFGDRFADMVAGAFGSMRTLWVLVVWMFGWMALATLGVGIFGKDAYPFAFLLFLSNLVQLWALPVLGVATNRADQKRKAKADTDHEALTHIAIQVDAIRTALGHVDDCS